MVFFKENVSARLQFELASSRGAFFRPGGHLSGDPRLDMIYVLVTLMASLSWPLMRRFAGGSIHLGLSLFGQELGERQDDPF